MEFCILGPLEVYDDGARLELGPRQQRALLAILLLHANEPVSTDRLIEELWEGSPPSAPAKNIQVLVSRLRKSIDERLITRDAGYVAHIEQDELDASRFQRLLEQGRRELAERQPGSAAKTLRDALGLWRGPPLAEFAYQSFAQREITRLEELRLAAIEERIEADLALARHGDVVAELDDLVAAHPLRERLRGQLMLALYRCGRQAEALESYRRGHRALAEELGLEPGPALRNLERSILAQDPTLDIPEPTPRASQPRRWPRPGLALLAGGAAIVVAAVAAALTLTLASGRATLSSIAADSVGIVDPHTGAIVGQVPLGAEPTALGAGDGSLWAITQGNRTVTRINTRSLRVGEAVALDGTPSGLAVGEGAVWVLNARTPTLQAFGGTPAEVSRIDPSVNDVAATVPTGTDYMTEVEGPISAGAGATWAATPESGQLPLVRIDPVRSRVTGRVPIAAEAVAAGREYVWAITKDGLERIEPGVPKVDAKIDVSGNAIALGDGAVWVLAQAYALKNCKFGHRFNCSLPGTLYRIDPRTTAVVATVPVGRRPVGLSAGGGAVWVVNQDDRTLMRVDARSNRVTETIDVGNPPTSVALGAGRVWVGIGSR